MTDRASATIQIGGAISSDLIEPLVEAIECDHGMIDWEGKDVDASYIVDGATLDICGYDLIGGQFDHVEDFCNEHRIPYVRNSNSCAGSFSAQRVIHTGDGIPCYYGTDESERIVLTRDELNELGTITAANAWFEAGAFTPSPFSIIAPTSDPEPWADHADYPLADWKYEIANDDTRLGYLDWIAAREAVTTGETAPAAEAPGPETPQLYLHLYHGRKDPDENLEDWGSEGPVIGPLAYVHTTYMCDVKFAASPDVMDRFFPTVMADWRERGLSNVAGPQCDWRLTVFNEHIEYDGVYYGDWTVFAATPSEIEERFATATEPA